MNEKLQRIYYLIGIVQRIAMIIMTFCMMAAAYKIYALTLKYGALFDSYGVEIKEIHRLVELIRVMLQKSWFF